jgi:hypothetical protein
MLPFIPHLRQLWVFIDIMCVPAPWGGCAFFTTYRRVSMRLWGKGNEAMSDDGDNYYVNKPKRQELNNLPLGALIKRNRRSSREAAVSVRLIKIRTGGGRPGRLPRAMQMPFGTN